MTQEEMAKGVTDGAFYCRDMGYATWWDGDPERIDGGWRVSVEDPDNEGEYISKDATDAAICAAWKDICRRWNISPENEDNFNSGHGMLGEGSLADAALQSAVFGEAVYG